MKLRNLRRDERGATAVIVALMLVVLLGAVALVVDLGRGYTLKAQMQSACDLAALAGAKKLPDQTQANLVAKQFAKDNGFDSASVEILDGGTKVKVSIKQTENTLFAGVLGVNKMDVGCHAIAGIDASPVSQKINPFFNYLLFHSGTTGTMTISSSLEAYGSIHSNADVSIQSCSVLGSVSSTGKFDGSVGYEVYNPTDPENDVYDDIGKAEKIWWSPEGYVGYVIKKKDGTTVHMDDAGYYAKVDGIIEVPSFIKDSAMAIIPTDGSGNPKMPTSNNVAVKGSVHENNSRVINGDVVINGNGEVWCDSGLITVNGNVYCNGNLKLQRVKINGNVFCTGCITTSGENITFTGDYIYADSMKPGNGLNVSGVIVTNHDFMSNGNMNQLDGGVAVLSLHGDIKLTSGGQGINGIVYAPEGKVTFGGTTTVHGSIIAKELSTNSKIKIYPMKESAADDLGDMVSGGGPSNPSGAKVVRMYE
ncbi:MAG: Tad domain-containing protein [Eubacterium sp.]|nr:Tad domain-containing protein [Eubacterium sp.]